MSDIYALLVIISDKKDDWNLVVISVWTGRESNPQGHGCQTQDLTKPRPFEGTGPDVLGPGCVGVEPNGVQSYQGLDSALLDRLWTRFRRLPAMESTPASSLLKRHTWNDSR